MSASYVSVVQTLACGEGTGSFRGPRPSVIDSAAGRELVEAEAGPAAWMNGEHVRDVSGGCRREGWITEQVSASKWRANFEMGRDPKDQTSKWRVTDSASEQPSSEKKSEPCGDESPWFIHIASFIQIHDSRPCARKMVYSALVQHV